MKKATHLTLGAAAALPVAASLGPGLALGCIWVGMAGGAFPDWLDLHSDFRRGLRLRHRGASHGLPLGMVLTALWAALLVLLHRHGLAGWTPPASAVVPLVVSFAAGFVSHLAADACTVAGIRPLLPFSSRRVWLLPGLLRMRTGGPLDFWVRWASTCLVVAGIVVYLRAIW